MAHQNDVIDQNLLQLFSCMGTTDRDELIRQLQILVGNKLDTGSARFYLEMNNWNLQDAVCSYFDLEHAQKLPSMALVRDGVNSEDFTVPPFTCVKKTWLFLNNGDDPWPDGCSLQFTAGDILSELKSLPISPIKPNATLPVTIEFISPNVPGIYQSKWRMVTPSGFYFGDIIWVIMSVTIPETTELAQQLSHLNTLGGQSPTVSSTVNPFSPQQRAFIQ